jgi:hypothetical protein
MMLWTYLHKALEVTLGGPRGELLCRTHVRGAGSLADGPAFERFVSCCVWGGLGPPRSPFRVPPLSFFLGF